MSEEVGKIGWHDLTVENADEVRDFYSAVAGWTVQGCDMGGYEDYSMMSGEDCVGGICHARGTNADMPAQWMIYITVADLDASMAACREKGGEVVVGPKTMGAARYCVVKDPAGAVAALYQKGSN